MSDQPSISPLSARPRQAAERRRLVDAAREVMVVRMGETGLNLPDVAQSLFVSSRHLQRAFAELGSPGFRWELTEMRVREAAVLLRDDPSLSVAQAAGRVGYRQPPYFAKAFRAHLGLAPGQWRQQCRRRAQQRSATATLHGSFARAA